MNSTDSSTHDFPELETPRLRLRELTTADAADVFAYAGDPEVQRYNGGTMENVDQARDAIQDALADDAAWTVLRWGITLKPEDAILGGVSLDYSGWPKTNHRAEIGYALAKAYWRRGIGTEAVAAVVRFAFEELHIHRLEASVTLDNVGSVRLLEKLGFVREGTSRESLLMDDAAYHSVGQYSLLDREYRQLAWVTRSSAD